MGTASSDPGDAIERLVDNVGKAIVGKRDVIQRAVNALVSGGHVLIEDVPGVGKTLLAKAIAKSIGGTFRRVQFTADLLPSDITGVNTYQQDSGTFAFRPGPIFTNVLLGDEINRATPRTQSSLLEAMEEDHVTVDGLAYPTEHPFLVIATQNPIELEGTYPLPFAQMDRFMIRLTLGYLKPDDEINMLRQQIDAQPMAAVSPVLTCDDLIAIRAAARRVTVTDDILSYVVRLVQSTRCTEQVDYGASPRAGLDLMHYAQTAALAAGRDYVLPDDIKDAAVPVLGHRLIVRKGTRRATLDSPEILGAILESTEVPL